MTSIRSRAVRERGPAASEQQLGGWPAAAFSRAGLAPWALVLLAPVLGVLLLRAPLVNMFGDADPWIYSGYGWALAHHTEMFGWPYYADRFTVILPIAVSSGLLGPLPGYLALRYLLMAGCGALLYLAVRRFASVPIAVAGACLLMLNPFFVRMMLWDYTPFVTTPCIIAGAALWYLGSTRTRALWTAVGAGICLSAAVYANPVAGLVLPALIAVEAIAAIRSGRSGVTTLVLRGCAMAAGALLLVIVGYLGDRAYIGSFPIKLMFEATIDFIRHNSQLSAAYQGRPSVFLRTDPEIYAPVLVCVGTVVILGRSLLSNTLRSRMAQFAIAYTLMVWVFRFTVTSSVIETWFAYNMTALTAAFAMPAILDELGRRSVRPRWPVVAGVAVVASGLIDLVIRSVGLSTALSVLQYVRTDVVVLACVLLACCIAAGLVAVLKRDAPRLIALAIFCAVVATIALTPAPGADTGNFSPFGARTELEAYQAGYDVTQLIAKYDRPFSRVRVWDDLTGFGSVGWVNLPDAGGALSDAFAPPPVPELSPDELATLRTPTTTRVLALAQSEDAVASSVPALQKQGLDPSLETEGIWANGHLYYALIKLHAG